MQNDFSLKALTQGSSIKDTEEAPFFLSDPNNPDALLICKTISVSGLPFDIIATYGGHKDKDPYHTYQLRGLYLQQSKVKGHSFLTLWQDDDAFYEQPPELGIEPDVYEIATSSEFPFARQSVITRRPFYLPIHFYMVYLAPQTTLDYANWKPEDYRLHEVHTYDRNDITKSVILWKRSEDLVDTTGFDGPPIDDPIYNINSAVYGQYVPNKYRDCPIKVTAYTCNSAYSLRRTAPLPFSDDTVERFDRELHRFKRQKELDIISDAIQFIESKLHIDE